MRILKLFYFKPEKKKLQILNLRRKTLQMLKLLFFFFFVILQGAVCIHFWTIIQSMAYI